MNIILLRTDENKLFAFNQVEKIAPLSWKSKKVYHEEKP